MIPLTLMRKCWNVSDVAVEMDMIMVVASYHSFLLRQEYFVGEDRQDNEPSCSFAADRAVSILFSGTD